MATEIKGLKWRLPQGSSRAIPVCPDHLDQEASVEDDGLEAGVKDSPQEGVILTCPKCGAILAMCAKAEFESEREARSNS